MLTHRAAPVCAYSSSFFSDKIYLAPSGVQKERMEPEDLFEVELDGREYACPPPSKGFTASQCTPLFFNAYNLRSAGACIHTHSQHAVMATLLTQGNEFRITHQEMIKGIRIGSTKSNLRFFDELVVPIIENTAEERDLTDRMKQAMIDYPDTNAILVRRHGVYVWGESWQKAKTMCECYDYLFEIGVKMKVRKKGRHTHARRTAPHRTAHTCMMATVEPVCLIVCFLSLPTPLSSLSPLSSPASTRP